MSEVTPEQRAAFKREQVRIAGSLMCGHGQLLNELAAVYGDVDPFAGAPRDDDECLRCGNERLAGHRNGCAWDEVAEELASYR